MKTLFIIGIIGALVFIVCVMITDMFFATYVLGYFSGIFVMWFFGKDYYKEKYTMPNSEQKVL